jgi:hypothetical protein
LPLILQIAARADPDLAAKLKQEGYGWLYRPAMETSRQLASLSLFARLIDRAQKVTA